MKYVPRGGVRSAICVHDCCTQSEFCTWLLTWSHRDFCATARTGETICFVQVAQQTRPKYASKDALSFALVASFFCFFCSSFLLLLVRLSRWIPSGYLRKFLLRSPRQRMVGHVAEGVGRWHPTSHGVAPRVVHRLYPAYFLGGPSLLGSPCAEPTTFRGGVRPCFPAC